MNWQSSLRSTFYLLAALSATAVLANLILQMPYGLAGLTAGTVVGLLGAVTDRRRLYGFFVGFLLGLVLWLSFLAMSALG